jgi:hypothetical protein
MDRQRLNPHQQIVAYFPSGKMTFDSYHDAQCWIKDNSQAKCVHRWVDSRHTFEDYTEENGKPVCQLQFMGFPIGLTFFNYI